MASDAQKTIARWVALAERAGWRIRRTPHGGHWRLYPANGSPPITVSFSPGKFNRALKNTRRDLRAAGLEI